MFNSALESVFVRRRMPLMAEDIEEVKVEPFARNSRFRMKI